MDYTFTDAFGKEKTVDIPMDYIRKQMASLNIGAMEACRLYLADEGYVNSPEAEELTKKANAGNAKSHKRKPDYVKLALAKMVADKLFNTEVKVQNEISSISEIELIEPGRVVKFNFMGDEFNLTLSRKRKKKQ